MGGPWSGYREHVERDVTLVVHEATFELTCRFRVLQTASNRGSDAIDLYELAGAEVALTGGARELRVTERRAERHEYHEPMEDMWTPPIDRVETLPTGALAAAQHFALALPAAGWPRQLTATVPGWGHAYRKLVETLVTIPLTRQG